MQVEPTRLGELVCCQLRRLRLAGAEFKAVEDVAVRRQLQGRQRLVADLEQMMQATAHHILQTRVHVVVWGQPDTLAHAVSGVVQAGRRVQLEFTPEPVLGATLFVQTLPLAFDPSWPKEQMLRRSRAAFLRRTISRIGIFAGPTAGRINAR